MLYELAHRVAPAAAGIAADLGLDAGYLSRIVHRFESADLLVRTPSAADRRQSVLHLPPVGRAALAPLDARSQAEIAALGRGREWRS